MYQDVNGQVTFPLKSGKSAIQKYSSVVVGGGVVVAG